MGQKRCLTLIKQKKTESSNKPEKNDAKGIIRL